MAPLGADSRAESFVGGVLLKNGRVLLGHRRPTRSGSPGEWELPGGRTEQGESPQAALERELREQLGAAVDLRGRPPDFQLAGEASGLSLWVMRSWRGEVAIPAPDEQDRWAWFVGDELASLPLADPRYLGMLSALLGGGKASLSWSEDGATVTKSLVPGIVIPQWASLLGTPRQAALNELRVNRMLARRPAPVPFPRLIRSSRRGPSMTFNAVQGAPLGPKFPRSISPSDLSGLVDLAVALGGYRPRRRWFRRLYIDHRLALHCRSGLIGSAEAEALAALAARTGFKWGFAHGDITARNVLRDARGTLTLIDWEWAGIYPVAYDLAFLWFSLAEVPEGRAKVEAAVPAHRLSSFLLSAILVHLLHLQLWRETPPPFVARHKETLGELLKAVVGHRRQ